MEILPDVNFKALIFGAAMAAAFILFGFQYWDWFCAFASTPIIILTFEGYLGTFKEGFFTTETGIMTVALTILVIGAFVGFVGAWAKKNRMKALEEYEKKQNIGKNKNKNKNK